MAKEKPPVPRLFYTVRELAKACGLSHQYVYELVAKGNIPSKKLGNRKLIPADAAHDWAENLPDSDVAA